jgi:putative ABC transport system ATP-binding protein
VSEPLLALDKVAVTFPGLPAPALDVPRLWIGAGSTVSLSGPSGSGKSTLANVMSGLERPGQGRVIWQGRDLTSLNEARRDRWRGANIGLVMQDFHLVAGLGALENVLLPARLRGWRLAGGLRARALRLLDEVGIGQPGQMVETMSRGEMQRIAVARALLLRPALVIADEPTASLDGRSAAAVAELLLRLVRAEKAALFVITHDETLAGAMERRLLMRSGRIVEREAAAA